MWLVASRRMDCDGYYGDVGEEESDVNIESQGPEAAEHDE